MTNGVAHETGETVRTIITALKSTPGTLSLVLFNIAFMAIVTYIQHTNGERWQQLLELTLKQCGARQ